MLHLNLGEYSKLQLSGRLGVTPVWVQKCKAWVQKCKGLGLRRLALLMPGLSAVSFTCPDEKQMQHAVPAKSVHL